MGNQKGEGRGNAKTIESCDFFIFIFWLLALIVTNTVFRNIELLFVYLKFLKSYFSILKERLAISLS